MQLSKPERITGAGKQQHAVSEKLAARHSIASSRRERGPLISAPGFSFKNKPLNQAFTGSFFLLPAVRTGKVRCRWPTLVKGVSEK